MTINNRTDHPAEKDGEHLSISSLQLWYQAILAKYDSVNNANTSLDNKTGMLFAACIAVVIFISAGIESIKSINPIAGIGLLGILLALGICIRIIYVRSSATPTSTTNERPEYYHMRDEEFIWQQIADLEQAIDKETSANTVKARLYQIVVWTLVLSSIFILISQIIVVTISIK